MNNQQRDAIRSVRMKILHSLANVNDQGRHVLDECCVVLASMNVQGPARTILDSFAMSDFLETFQARAAMRAALPFLNPPTTHLFASRTEAARIGPVFASLSELIEKDHATTIGLLVDLASRSNGAMLVDAADRLQAERINVELAGKHGYAPDAVDGIQDAAEHLRQAERLLRAAATKEAQS